MIQLHAGFIKVRTQLHQGRRAEEGEGLCAVISPSGWFVVVSINVKVFVSLRKTKKKTARVEQSCALVVFEFCVIFNLMHSESQSPANVLRFDVSMRE